MTQAVVALYIEPPEPAVQAASGVTWAYTAVTGVKLSAPSVTTALATALIAARPPLLFLPRLLATSETATQVPKASLKMLR